MDHGITIRLQPRLGFMRTFKLTVNGIRYRIFRSAVTMAVISVAIAFMMNVVVENIIKRAMVDRAIDRLESLRMEAFWTARLISPSSRRLVLMNWATSDSGSSILRESAGFGGMSAEEIDFLQEQARSLRAFLHFVEELDYGQQRFLLAGHGDISVFDYLAEPGNLQQFEAALGTTRGLRVPLSIEALTTHMEAWPRTVSLFERIQSGHAAAIRQVRAALGGQSVEQALREVDGAFGEVLRAAGFVLEPEAAFALAENARASSIGASVEQTLSEPRLRQAMAARANLMPQEIGPGDLWRLAHSESGSRWLAERLLEFELVAIGREELERALRYIAQRTREENLMVRVERMGNEVGERMFWLILLSLIVCVVGIANAMLMSVTERYREIATFKCLGALNGSIMLIFVIEAALLGLVGGIIGAVVGTVLGFGNLAFRFGTLAFRGVPLGSLWLSVLFAIVAGVILAALAAVYPSLKAARLAPMEAMRIE